MLKNTLLLILLYVSFTDEIYSQRLSYYAGISYNTLLFPEVSFPDAANAKMSLGPRTGLAFEKDIVEDQYGIKVSLGIEKFGGDISYLLPGLGGSASVEANLQKWITTVGLYPINIEFAKHFQVGLGADLLFLIHEKNKGRQDGRVGLNSYSYDIATHYKRYSNKFVAGFRFYFCYNYEVSESIIISPEYNLFFSQMDEYKQFPTSTNTLKNYIGLSVKKNFFKSK